MRPAAVICTDAVSGEARTHAQRLDARGISGAFGELSLSRPCGSDPDPDLGDVAVILFTTGTTGVPKGVMLTHANLRFGGKSSAELRGLTAADRIYGVLPVSHVFGLSSVMTAAIYAGAHVQLEARFSVDRLYRALSGGITVFSGVPQMHALLMQYAREQGHGSLRGGALRYVSSGAAPLDPVWKRKAESFYGVAVQNGYGMTETTAGIAASRAAPGDPDVSVGPPLPGVELRLDETVTGGGAGLGEILTRGPHVMKGYYRNPRDSAAVLDEDGWLRTGDLGRFDTRGHLLIEGRCKEIIIHGGFNVYPPEVEAALNEHPQVVQSAVVGWSCDGDELVVAFVQAGAGAPLDPEELRAFAARRLAGYKRPGRIIVTDALPAAPTGKIQRHRLLEVFGEQLRESGRR